MTGGLGRITLRPFAIGHKLERRDSIATIAITRSSEGFTREKLVKFGRCPLAIILAVVVSIKQLVLLLNHTKRMTWRVQSSSPAKLQNLIM
jgi:hypothetical protein